MSAPKRGMKRKGNIASFFQPASKRTQHSHGDSSNSASVPREDHAPASSEQNTEKVGDQKSSRKRQSGFDPAWKEQYSWVVTTSDRSGNITGMLCNICMAHQPQRKGGLRVWMKVPCTTLEKESLRRHAKTEQHRNAEAMAATAKAAEQNGGIRQAFTEQVNLERMAFLAALRGMYWLTNVIENMHGRFPDNILMSAFNVFDPSEADHDQANKLELLCEHYEAEVSREDVMSEYQVMSTLMLEHYNHLSTNDMLRKVRQVHADTMPNMAKLAAAIAVIPVSTADCERGFSTMKRVKTALRNRMKADTLNNLLMISIEGPDAEEFNFDSACDNWASMCKRRLNVTTST